ncbi:MAG: pyridoxamine 5'-phosphate oxidase family protein [bacterium]|nr:pyridoxamine 5'-phosphate oxidase family protein [bacterium]
MNDLQKYISEILQEGYLMSLATSDTVGLWVADVIYVHNDLDIYWASHMLARHSRALERNPSVAGSITLTQRTDEPDKGLQIAGIAGKLFLDTEKILTLYRKKRGKAADYSLPSGYAWYCLKPSIMDLIYEPVFGGEKQKILSLKI